MKPQNLFVPGGLAIALIALLWWGVATARADAPEVIPLQMLLENPGQDWQSWSRVITQAHLVRQGQQILG